MVKIGDPRRFESVMSMTVSLNDPLADEICWIEVQMTTPIGRDAMLFNDFIDPAARFALRELEKEDAAGLELLDRVLFFPFLRHVARPRQFLEMAIAAQSSEPRPSYFIGIVSPDDRGQLIGIVGAILTYASGERWAHSFEVGYALTPDFQNRGIAKSALLAFLAIALPPQVTELTATVDPENLASIRLLEACGFERSGLVQASKYLGDPDNPAHYVGGLLQLRPRIEYRTNAYKFRKLF
jgi:RimJ/RimL family protein N-acetyltransferase